jgi:hypothetical protein
MTRKDNADIVLGLLIVDKSNGLSAYTNINKLADTRGYCIARH